MVTHDRLGLTKCRLREISLDGALIQTKNFVLAKGANIDLVLKIRSEEKRTHCRLPAKVIRVNKDGTAIVFNNLDDEAYHILFDIVCSEN